MARIRSVKPDLFRHEGLYDLERTTKLPIRLAFIALFTACDKEGRFRWLPNVLKLDCMPYDSVDFGKVLDALRLRGFVIQYKYGNDLYGFIPTWKKHQRITGKEAAGQPKYPEPSGETTVQHLGNNGETPVNTPDVLRNKEQGTRNKEQGTDKATELLPYLPDFPRVQSLSKPLTEIEHQKLIEEWGEAAVRKILTDMENYKPLTKNNVSAYLTAGKWLQKELERNPPKPPTGAEVGLHFQSKDWPQAEALAFYAHYEAVGWKTGSGLVIANWKAKAYEWINKPKT